MGLFILAPAEADRRATIASLVIAFAIATILYKFGNFALECLAFLATWFIIDLPLQWIARSLPRPGRRGSR